MMTNGELIDQLTRLVADRTARPMLAKFTSEESRLIGLVIHRLNICKGCGYCFNLVKSGETSGNSGG